MRVPLASVLAALALASGSAAREIQTTPPESARQEDTERAQTPTDTDALGEPSGPSQPDAPPPPPPAPDGILPLAELARVSFSPRDRPVPTLFGDTLVIVTTGSIASYDAVSGEFSWKLGLPGEALFRPQTVDAPSNRLLVASASGRLIVLDRETGEIQDELDLGVEIAMPPLVRASELVLVTPAGEVLFYDWGTRTERFRSATNESPLGLAWSRDRIVVSGALRTLTAIDANDGSADWRFIGRGPFPAAATIGANGRVYTGDDLGEFYSLGGEDGKVKFRWSTGGAVRLSPLVEEDRVYVATLGNTLYCYGARGGSEQWRASLPGRPVFGPLRVQQRYLIVTYEGVFVEVQAERGRVTKRWAAPGELASPPSFHIVPRPLLPLEPLPSSETAPFDGDVPESREPLWFERSRVVFALRNGDVLLLKHEAPTAAPKGGDESEPSEEPPPKKSGEEPARDSRPRSLRPPGPP